VGDIYTRFVSLLSEREREVNLFIDSASICQLLRFHIKSTIVALE
jgi:hypothetical protein